MTGGKRKGAGRKPSPLTIRKIVRLDEEAFGFLKEQNDAGLVNRLLHEEKKRLYEIRLK